MNITIVGLGYVGITVLSCLECNKHKITGFDIDKDKIQKLKSGECYIKEPQVEERLVLRRQKVKFVTLPQEAFGNADVIFVCVNTPGKENGDIELSYIHNCIDEIIQYAKQETLVVIKSTVPIGECRKMQENINLKSRKIEIAYNPEFLAQGEAIKNFINPARIVLGVQSEKAADILKKIYKDIGNAPVLVNSLESAEMIKYAANTFLAMKISYINEIANICEFKNANINDVIEGIGLDQRIGNKYLKPGVGFGGSCLEKDVRALINQGGKENGKIFNEVININNMQKFRLIEKIYKYYNDLEGLNIAVLGVAFKPETDDIRNSISVENIGKLLYNKANIKVWDKFANKNILKKFPQVYCYNSIDEAITNADVCLIFTQWQEIIEYDLKKYKELMKKPIILDGRNCYNSKNIKKQGIIYDYIGGCVKNE